MEIAKNALNGIIGKFQLLNKFSDVFSTSNRTMLRLFSLYILQMVRQPIGRYVSYQDAVFIGQVYGRDDKKIETDTLNLKGTGGVFRMNTQKISGKVMMKKILAVMRHS